MNENSRLHINEGGCFCVPGMALPQREKSRREPCQAAAVYLLVISQLCAYAATYEKRGGHGAYDGSVKKISQISKVFSSMKAGLPTRLCRCPCRSRIRQQRFPHGLRVMAYHL